ncbi:MAG TPA: hypothetical protein PK947_13205, partial [Ottowia sp.]|nr:hypothetical protein [Ottowia sp.]
MCIKREQLSITQRSLLLLIGAFGALGGRRALFTLGTRRAITTVFTLAAVAAVASITARRAITTLAEFARRAVFHALGAVQQRLHR